MVLLATAQASFMEAKKFSFLDDGGDLGRDHDFPAGIAFLDTGEHVPGKNRQVAFVVIFDRLDEVVSTR